jgi:hypothetical protein
MAEIINLREKKKALNRTKKRAEGDENAARSGRTKALKSLENARLEKDRAGLDAHKREPKE